MGHHRLCRLSHGSHLLRPSIDGAEQQLRDVGHCTDSAASFESWRAPHAHLVPAESGTSDIAAQLTREDQEVTNDTQDYDAFARILQTAYQEVRRSTPRSRPEVEERLRTKLEAYGVTLTTDILRALAFAVVTGRDL